MNKIHLLVFLFDDCLNLQVFQENNLSNEKLMFQYEMNKKEPWGAVAGTFLLPSVGHAYAGNWGRGLKFLSGEILALVLMANASSDNVENDWNFMFG